MIPAASDRQHVYLLAYPAGHSLSPVMHQAAFDALGIDADYRALEVAPADLAASVAGFRSDPTFLGANVTVPHKRAVMPLLDSLTPEARSVGAVNTISRDGEQLRGSNTDIDGFTRALAEAWPLSERPAQVRALILGAGGSARAVAWALLKGGAILGITARRPEAAAELIAEAKTWALPHAEHAEPLEGRVEALSQAEAREWLPGCDLLVNSTPLGMQGGPGPAMNPAPGPLTTMRKGAMVLDLVYRPARTPLLDEAAAVGMGHANGLSMLVWQGALSFATWTARAAPVALMAAAAERGLAERR